jgi:hypothetical protein
MGFRILLLAACGRGTAEPAAFIRIMLDDNIADV